MKKLLAALMALTLIVTAGAVALAEETAVPTFANGIQFNMDLDQVREMLNLPNPEVDKEVRGTTEFWELEYENVVSADDGFVADIKYLFVGNGLVAFHMDMADGTGYDNVKDALTREFGEAVPFDAAKIGNAKFVIDDDGDLKDCLEMIEANGLTIVLELDHDGDVDVTFFDPTAAYINN